MGTEIAQVLQGIFRAIDGPTVFLKIDTEGDKARCSSISQLELRRHRSCVEDSLVLAVNGRCSLVARLHL